MNLKNAATLGGRLNHVGDGTDVELLADKWAAARTALAWSWRCQQTSELPGWSSMRRCELSLF
jgi:hypothetical protein